MTESAQKIIENYKNLKIGNKTIPCPYFINKGQKVRGALRVLIGKGSPKDIEEEVALMALKSKVNLKKMNEKEIAEFLVEKKIGLDCSGFVYHVMDAELAAKGKKLSKTITFPKKGLLRKILTKLRPAENTSVAVLFDDKNTKEIKTKDIEAGDLILMLETGKNHDLNHVLLITKKEDKKNKTLLHYAHSLKWKNELPGEHGVREGVIELVDTKKPLTKQVWIEKGKKGKENETFERALSAKRLKIGRLK